VFISFFIDNRRINKIIKPYDCQRSENNNKIQNQRHFKACLVTYPSIIPAQMVKGTVLKNILNESLNPFLKELNLESVFGNKIEAPRIKPHMASTTIAKISKLREARFLLHCLSKLRNHKKILERTQHHAVGKQCK
jgi:hypothetical protein